MENEMLYTKKEVKAAQDVRAFSLAMGGMSMANLMETARGRRIEGLTFGPQDVSRAFRIYGPSLEMVRGGTVKAKRAKAVTPVRDTTVSSELSMQIDIMFTSGVAFLIGITKPVGLLMCSWIKSRSTADVKEALDSQRSKLSSEGFKLTEISSDSEGAIQSIKSELEDAGCRVSIHGPNTESAEVDRAIRKAKEVVRGTSSTLPFMLPFVLLMYLVFFAVHKVNMLPKAYHAHGYSPLEIFTGRAISLSRDLGATKSTGPMPFGARCEVYEKTTNTVADRTRPAVFLGMKSNAYGSGLFFTLDTERVISREQWKPLPMDLGTINLLNKVARKGPLLSKNIRFIHKNAELLDEGEVPEEAIEECEQPDRAAASATGDAYDPTDLPPEVAAEEEEYRVIGPEETYSPPEGATLEQMRVEYTGERLDESQPKAVEMGGAAEGSPANAEGERRMGVTEQLTEEPRGDEHNAGPLYWERIDVASADARAGGGERRSARPKRDVDRYTPGAYFTLDDTWKAASGLPKQLRVLKEPTRVLHAGAREHAFTLTVEKALRTYKEKAEVSITKEIQNMLDKKVFIGVKWDSMSVTQRAATIRSSLFLKEKYLSTGEFDKLKARLVAGGHMQDRSIYAAEETSSPTVSLSSLYMVAALASKEERIVSTKDVGSAYLNAKMERDVFMTLQPNIAKILVQIDPNYKACIRGDGSAVVKLDKALYGCIESSKLWYDDLSQLLKASGFVENAKDKCVFNMERDGCQLTVCVYVDDLFCTSRSRGNMDWIDAVLKEKYKDVSSNEGLVHSYLGQTFDFRREGECKVSMAGYTSDFLEEYGVIGKRVTPAAEDVFEVDPESEKLPDEGAKKFHSRVAKLLYMALRTRPDIILAVSFLSTRVTKSTAQDWSKLERVLMYINMCPDLGIVLRAEDGLKVMAHVDASFAVHPDMKGQSGSMITLGSGPVYVASKKQGIVTKSSTESELVAISDMLPMVIWTRGFLKEQGYKMDPAVLYQDNKSTIAMANRGSSNSPRTRHVDIRYFFVKDRIEAGEIVVEHMGTDRMLADGMTKPLQGELFRRMRKAMMGM